MNELNISELERLARELELEALYQYEHGTGEAPVLYKAEGFLQTLGSKEPKNQEMVFVASEESEDRVGDIISAGGWDLSNFKKNPVWMFVHNYGVAPLGTVPKIWVEGKQLLNTVNWDDADELARFIKGKYERGIMRAVSVGFRPLEFKAREDKESDGMRRPGFHFTKQELLEISAVPVPMHPRALQKAMGERGFSIVVPEPTWMADYKIHPGALKPVEKSELPKIEPVNITLQNKPMDDKDIQDFQEHIKTILKTEVMQTPIETKAGAVLSRTNKAKLNQAIGLLQEVLATSAAPEEEAEKEEERVFVISQDEIAELINNVFGVKAAETTERED